MVKYCCTFFLPSYIYDPCHTQRSQYSRLVTTTQKINQIKKILLFLLVFSTSVSVRIKLLTRLHIIDIYQYSTIKISSTNVSFNFVSFLFCPPGEVQKLYSEILVIREGSEIQSNHETSIQLFNFISELFHSVYNCSFNSSTVNFFIIKYSFQSFTI